MLQDTVPIEGKTWAIEEITMSSNTGISPTNAPGPRPRPDPPCVVTQHAVPPRKFVIVSAQGIHVFQKLRPLEQLRRLFIECGGPDAEQVKAFFRLHRVSYSVNLS